MLLGAPALPWDWEPSVLVGCALLVVLYAWGVSTTRSANTWRWLAFALGDLILLLALCSPLDTLADRYLFSAHMAQHLLLLELVAPLLVLAMPARLIERLLTPAWVSRLEQRLRQPWLAWTIGFLTLAFWHLPGPYDAAVRSEGLHIVQHLSFLVSATIFWWPVLAPLERSRMQVGTSIFYLFSRMAANLVLGSVIAALPLDFYAAYRHAPPAPLPLAISPRLDLQLGGYLMWIPSLLIDAAAVPLILALLFSPGGLLEQRRQKLNLAAEPRATCPGETDCGASEALRPSSSNS